MSAEEDGYATQSASSGALSQTHGSSSSSSSTAVASSGAINSESEAVVDNPWALRKLRLREICAQFGADDYTTDIYVADDNGDEEDEDEDKEDEEEDEEEDDDVEVRLSGYSAERLNKSVFHLIMTQRREQMMAHYERFVLGDQSEADFMMFNTSFSYQIFATAPKEIKRILAMKKPDGAKLDSLLFLMYNLGSYDVWMHDNEDPDSAMAIYNALSRALLKLLEKSDAELEIDSDFTRPAVVAMIKSFKAKLDSY